jgi:hypothetical protein
MRAPNGANALVWGALAAVALAVATVSCGDDDGGSGAAGTTTTAGATVSSAASTSTSAASSSTASSTTAATTATTAATSTTTAAALTGDELAAATAYETVFDSATGLDAKARYLPDAIALAPTIEAYGATGSRLGGIRMDVTAVAVAGDEATATYDVLFGGKPAYQQLTGKLQRVGGNWTVSRSEFCSFMSSARTPCA